MSDPTGTAAIRKSFTAAMDKRWNTLRQLVIEAITSPDIDILKLVQPTVNSIAVAHSVTFSSWLSEAIRRVILSDNGWMNTHIDHAVFKARQRAAKLAGVSIWDKHGARSTVVENHSRLLARSELKGIAAVVEQQCVREATLGVLSNKRPAYIARMVAQRVNAIGKTRGRMLVSWIIIKAFSNETLAAFEEAGITKVGSIPEKVRKVLATDAASSDKRGEKSKAKKQKKRRKAKRAKPLLVEWLTAGDDKVCDECQDASDDGPYTLDEARDMMPLHPNCRCAWVPADDARFAAPERLEE